MYKLLISGGSLEQQGALVAHSAQTVRAFILIDSSGKRSVSWNSTLRFLLLPNPAVLSEIVPEDLTFVSLFFCGSLTVSTPFIYLSFFLFSPAVSGVAPEGPVWSSWQLSVHGLKNEFCYLFTHWVNRKDASVIWKSNIPSPAIHVRLLPRPPLLPHWLVLFAVNTQRMGR